MTGAIEIGNHTHITGSTHIACIEGKTVSIGEKCLFAQDITLRIGDSHSILNEQGLRTNPSDDIEIKSHVWVGHKVTILKGSVIGEDCVIGTSSVVTGKVYQKGSMLVGIPAKVIKEKISWCPETISDFAGHIKEENRVCI